jgi:hypothetical protein
MQNSLHYQEPWVGMRCFHEQWKCHFFSPPPPPRKMKASGNLVYVIHVYAVQVSESSYANKRRKGLHFILKYFHLQLICKSL